ncbi:chitin synthase I [Dipodascopsis tothii]|uniref:chitin synthase I n=1 Tax=Dipodascopsis tothii TaxID=44089 RepID=UPI0034CD7A47
MTQRRQTSGNYAPQRNTYEDLEDGRGHADYGAEPPQMPPSSYGYRSHSPQPYDYSAQMGSQPWRSTPSPQPVYDNVQTGGYPNYDTQTSQIRPGYTSGGSYMPGYNPHEEVIPLTEYAQPAPILPVSHNVPPAGQQPGHFGQKLSIGAAGNGPDGHIPLHDDFYNRFTPTHWGPGESYDLNTYDEDEDTQANSDQEYHDDIQGNENMPILNMPSAGSQSYTMVNSPSGLTLNDDGMIVPAAGVVPEQPQYDADGNIMPQWQIPSEGNQPRRNKTVKVRMFRGNLVLDCPVSTKLLERIGTNDEREFTHMRYTAATCDPSQFSASDFTLRQTIYPRPRQTEIAIVVTLYNEDDELLARTLNGVFKNIRHLCTRSGSRTWGPEGWRKVVVVVVADGRQKINARARSVMAALGCYQEGIAVNIVDEKPVTAHLYEYTTKVGFTSTGPLVRFSTTDTVPVQLLFCLKEKNQKKINSHRWFFQAFGTVLNPRVCVLLDAGTQPGYDSIYHLWKEFDRHANVAGACGEIKASLGKMGRKLLNPLVAAQNFEYKMSNILDKPLESAFGFISVLPGAFSAYRYEALQSTDGEGPLDKYFKGEHLHDFGAGLFTSNMYLAEDRILCYELVAKRGQNWTLRYVNQASAATDVPEQLYELILQRRRWLNGSFFAAIYSLSHAFKIWKSNHSFFRKIMFHIEFAYQLFAMLFSWFGIGNFFLVFRLLTASLGDSSYNFGAGKYLSVVFEWMYMGSLVTCFVLSFGNRPKGTQAFYTIMVWFFAVLMVYLIFAIVFVSVHAVQSVISDNNGFAFKLLFTNSVLRGIMVSLLSTYILYFLASFMFLEFGHMFTSFIQYILISPSYINVLNVYAFCNIHDISWGTKGDVGQKLDLGVAKTDEKGKLTFTIPTKRDEIDQSYLDELRRLDEKPEEVDEKQSEQDQTADYYALIRSIVVLIWMLSNFTIVAVVLNTAGFERLSTSTDSTSTDETITNTRSSIYLEVILWAVAAMALIRFIGATFFLCGRWLGL